jgi:alkylation response protein AidB-like acyl-CoA dehydrogenase
MSDRSTEDVDDLLEKAAAFARTSLRQEMGAADRDGVFDRKGWTACADHGVHGMSVPVEHGGTGASLTELVAVMEGLGYGSQDMGLLFALNAHLWTVAVPVALHGTREQREAYLPGLLDGSLIGANASTEAEAGSDVYSMRTQAIRDGDSYVLGGEKTFITNAPIADLYVVYATIDPEAGPMGVTAFLVRAGTPGLRVSDPFEKMGMRTAAMEASASSTA